MNEITGLAPVFLSGASGVIVIEAAKFAAASMGQNAHQKTKRYKHRTYWLGLLVLVLVAGFVTAVSAGSGPIKFITALQIGINAPALVTAWATASQRDRTARAKRPSLELSPVETGGRPDSQGLLQRILDDQAL